MRHRSFRPAFIIGRRRSIRSLALVGRWCESICAVRSVVSVDRPVARDFLSGLGPSSPAEHRRIALPLRSRLPTIRWLDILWAAYGRLLRPRVVDPFPRIARSIVPSCRSLGCDRRSSLFWCGLEPFWSAAYRRIAPPLRSQQSIIRWSGICGRPIAVFVIRAPSLAPINFFLPTAVDSFPRVGRSMVPINVPFARLRSRPSIVRSLAIFLEQPWAVLVGRIPPYHAAAPVATVGRPAVAIFWAA